MGRAGEKESKLGSCGLLKGGKYSSGDGKWSSGLIVLRLPSIQEAEVINLSV